MTNVWNFKMNTIIQITDTHLFKNDNEEIVSVKSNQKFKEVMKKIEKDLPDYFFITGDVSQDETPESYQKMVDLIDELGVVTYWIPGNHDNLEIMQKIFNRSRYIEQIDYLTCSNWNFIFLHTKLDGKTSGRLSEQELVKLDSLLKENKKPNIALIMHHHPIHVNTPLIDRFILQNRKHFWDIVDKYEQIKLIMCGHVHGDYTVTRNQLTMESGPATCLQWKKGTHDLVIDKMIGYKKYQFNIEGYQAEAIMWR